MVHTWSLAVEEQFYLVFPLVIMALWPLGKRFILASILAIITCSLMLSQILSKTHIDANYYLITSRAWELAAGAFVAMVPREHITRSSRLANFASYLGLGLIILSITMFSKSTPFPSLYTVIPVLGTAFIIIFSDQLNHAGRLLSHKYLMFFGFISYSLYLWHQPIFAFLRVNHVGEPSLFIKALAILLCIGLAYFSWRYIEAPFRKKDIFSRNRIFVLSALSLISVFSIGAVIYGFHGFPERFETSEQMSGAQPSPLRDKCHTRGIRYQKPSDACKYFGENINWATLGDSHLTEISYSLGKILSESNEGLLHLTFSGCPPGLGFQANRPGCSNWLTEAIKRISDDQSIQNVMVGFHYAGHLYGPISNTFPDIPSLINPNTFHKQYAAFEEEQLEALFWGGLDRILSSLEKSKKKIYVLYPLPELPTDIRNAIKPLSIFHEKAILDSKKSTTRDYQLRRNREVLEALAILKNKYNFTAIDPIALLCSESYCPYSLDSKLLYFDNNHLSINGATLLLERANINKGRR